MNTKIVMLTGFLGSGKTTLLSALLDAYQDQKIGLIVNEFGEISIDGPLLERNGVQMKELANGSIFCACIKDHFLTSLIAMSAEPIETLFIEASGLADPSNMGTILRAIEKKITKPYKYLGAICVADAETYLEYSDLLPALTRQVEYSSAVLINKVDLVDDETLVSVISAVTERNPTASLRVTTFCKTDYPSLLEELVPCETPPEESTNTYESRPKTLVLHFEEPVTQSTLIPFLEELSKTSYRIKGFVLTDTGGISVSAVKNHVTIEDWGKPIENAELVVISAVGIRAISVASSLVKQYFNGSVSL